MVLLDLQNYRWFGCLTAIIRASVYLKQLPKVQSIAFITYRWLSGVVTYLFETDYLLYFFESRSKNTKHQFACC